MKLISWNVASVRARMGALTKLLTEQNPDVVLVQETKTMDKDFPFFDLQMAGYHSYIAPQKSFNGVAILSKEPLKNVNIVLPHFTQTGDLQARFIEGVLPDGTHLICVYVPNGNPPANNPADVMRLHYKLEWMKALTAHVKGLLDAKIPVILGGDFNVIERDTDVYNPEAYRSNALMVPPVRAAFEELCSLPLICATRLKNPDPHTYSFWDFQMGAWPKNWGMLLDYFFVSKTLGERLESAPIYKDARGWEKTSDHVPILLILK